MITALTIGLAWQFVLVMLLVRREQGTLRWRVLREVLWLRAPDEPQDRPSRRAAVADRRAADRPAAAKDFVPKLPHAGEP